MVLKKQYGNMPKIRVRFFANFREFTKTSELEIEGSTLNEILKLICSKFRGIENMLFKDGNLRPYVNIFLNGENVLEPGKMEKSLQTGDEISIFPPVSGG